MPGHRCGADDGTGKQVADAGEFPVLMSCVDILVEDTRTHVESTAIVWEDAEYSYGWLLGSIDCWTERPVGMGIGPGTVFGVVGD